VVFVLMSQPDFNGLEFFGCDVIDHRFCLARINDGDAAGRTVAYQVGVIIGARGDDFDAGIQI